MKACLKFILANYLSLLFWLGRIEDVRIRPGNTCVTSGKYFVLHSGRVVDVDIDVTAGRQFPPTKEPDSVFVLYKTR